MAPLYMTPGRFRIGGYGVDLTGIDEVEIRAILRRASAMVNSYCTVPSTPVEHDFRGGTITDEPLRWELGHELLPAQRRVFPRHTPLRELIGFRIDVTNSQYISFTDNEIYVTPQYFEVTSLAMTSVGLFGAGIIPNIGLRSPVARVSYEYGELLPVAGEELEETDSRLYRAMNQWWWEDPLPVVRVDGDALPADDYTIDYDEGTVLLDEPTSGTVTVDYAHRLHPDIAEAAGLIAVERFGERGLTRKGLHGLVELAVGEVRIRRDFPRAGVQKHGVSDTVMQLLDPHKFITAMGAMD